MLKTKPRTFRSSPVVDADITQIRAPSMPRPHQMTKTLALVLILIGMAPVICVAWAFHAGQDVHDLGNQMGPYLLLAWPVGLAIGARLWFKKLKVERKKTADEWRKPLIAARSRIAALEVVARARYQRPDGWPDDWPRDNIS